MGLDYVELLMAAEDQFGISIPDDEAVEFMTPRAMHEYLMMRLSAAQRITESKPSPSGVTVLDYYVKSPPPPPRLWTDAEVWEAVVSLVAKVSGVEPSRIKHDSHFVRDLGFS